MDDTDELVNFAAEKAKKLDPKDEKQAALQHSICERAANVMLARKESRKRKAIQRLLERVA